MLGWGRDAKTFSPDPEYQSRLRSLLGQFTYRLDTNFAKMDRIALRSLEDFKQQVLCSEIKGRTVAEWSRVLRRANTAIGKSAIAGLIGVS